MKHSKGYNPINFLVSFLGEKNKIQIIVAVMLRYYLQLATISYKCTRVQYEPSVLVSYSYISVLHKFEYVKNYCINDKIIYHFQL